MSLPESDYDPLMENFRCRSNIRCNRCVMEAALRTAYEIVTGREVPFKI